MNKTQIMTQARSTIVSLEDTPYYHCVSRCVRRAFLCGYDTYSKRDYEHCRDWLETKLLKTAESFALSLCAYAVMSNHYHVVLRVDVEQAKSWSKQEVVKRWHSLFAGNHLSHQYLSGCQLDSARLALLTKDIEIWRARLSDISWLMRIVNEAIARQANQEDGCTGRFWEGRFKSQALLDERALLACMAYVDLNPVRASIAQSPETSEYTSVKQRIDCLRNTANPSKALASFTGGNQQQNGLPFELTDYLELVDWTGRVIREDKRGAISATLPPILQRLSLESDAWRLLTTTFESQFKQWVGSEHIVRQVYSDKHFQRIPSTSSHKALFG